MVLPLLDEGEVDTKRCGLILRLSGSFKDTRGPKLVPAADILTIGERVADEDVLVRPDTPRQASRGNCCLRRIVDAAMAASGDYVGDEAREVSLPTVYTMLMQKIKSSTR